ncbi:hypothetical protein D3C71_1962090 [compost metagenome]
MLLKQSIGICRLEWKGEPGGFMALTQEHHNAVAVLARCEADVHQKIPKNFFFFGCVATLPFSEPQKNSHSDEVSASV